MAFAIITTAWQSGGPIPVKHTCDGANHSPPLSWSHAPRGTKSLALVVDDPDAPMDTWVHWVLYDIPAARSELPEGVPPLERVAGVGFQGVNDFKKVGYGGPCPPRGAAHRYFFKLYAVDLALELKPRLTKEVLVQAMKGHVLGQAEVMGTYARR